MNDGKKFDIILINPPYEAGHHLYMYFLEKSSQLSENLISINPIGFIFSKTNKGIHKKLKEQINKCKVVIDEIDGNKVFKDASFLGFNLGICTFSNNSNNDKENVTINYLNGDIRNYNSEEQITKADLSNSLVKSIIEKINNYSNHKLWEIFNFLPNYTGFGLREKIKKFDKDQLFVNLPIKTDDIVNWAFFSNKNSKRNEVLTAGLQKTSGGIAVNSKVEGDNIIKYLKTDIIRFCYFLGNNGYNGGWKGFELIPLFNFKDEIFNKSLHDINNELYNKFDLTKEEIKYIQDIITDYYGIRKTL